MTFTIEGAPRTKKNSQQIVRVNGRPIVIQSKQYKAWSRSAVEQLLAQRVAHALTVPVNMRALVYRERAGRADLLNYLAAVSDALEEAGVVADDKLVAGVDGSRLLVDRHCPRVEITLEPMEAAPPGQLTAAASP